MCSLNCIALTFCSFLTIGIFTSSLISGLMLATGTLVICYFFRVCWSDLIEDLRAVVFVVAFLYYAGLTTTFGTLTKLELSRLRAKPLSTSSCTGVLGNTLYTGGAFGPEILVFTVALLSTLTSSG